MPSGTGAQAVMVASHEPSRTSTETQGRRFTAARVGECMTGDEERRCSESRGGASRRRCRARADNLARSMHGDLTVVSNDRPCPDWMNPIERYEMRTAGATRTWHPPHGTG